MQTLIKKIKTKVILIPWLKYIKKRFNVLIEKEKDESLWGILLYDAIMHLWLNSCGGQYYRSYRPHKTAEIRKN